MFYLLQAQEGGRVPEHTSKFYAKGALEYLVPMLTLKLTNQVRDFVSFHLLILFAKPRTLREANLKSLGTFCRTQNTISTDSH